MIEGDGDGDTAGDRRRRATDRPPPPNPSRPGPHRRRPARRRRRASGRRRRPGLRARPATAAAISAIADRFDATPLFAASRSTTWIHSAPSAAESSATADRDRRRRWSPGRSRPGAGGRPGRRAGRSTGRAGPSRGGGNGGRAASDVTDEVAEQGEARLGRLLRMELHGGHGTDTEGGVQRRARSRTSPSPPRVVGNAVERVDEVEPRLLAGGRRTTDRRRHPRRRRSTASAASSRHR